jgi:hypothetical protein
MAEDDRSPTSAGTIGGLVAGRVEAAGDVGELA